MEQEELSNAVLELVNDPGYQPVKPKMLAKRLHLDEDGIRRLKQVVRKLVKQGRIGYGANHLVSPMTVPRQKPKVIIGTFRRTDHGYGFVRVKAAPIPSSDRDGLDRESLGSGIVAPPEQQPDLYIAAGNTLDAAHGDTVAVRMRKRKSQIGEKPEAEIVEVLERETHQFVGTYQIRGGAGLRVGGRQGLRRAHFCRRRRREERATGRQSRL